MPENQLPEPQTDDQDVVLEALPQGQKPKLNTDQVTAVVDARFRRDVGAPEAARQRAQAGWVVVSAVSAALVSAGALGDLDQESTGLRLVGLAALLFWIAAAALFLWAVAVPAKQYDPPRVKGTAQVLKHILTSAKNERDVIDSRQWWARAASAVAVVLTAITLGILLFSPADESARKDVLLQPNAEARKDFARLCDVPEAPDRIPASLETKTAGDGTLEVKFPAGTCGPSETEAVVDDEDYEYVFAGD